MQTRITRKQVALDLITFGTQAGMLLIGLVTLASRAPIELPIFCFTASLTICVSRKVLRAFNLIPR